MRSFPLAVLTPRERAFEGEILSLVLPTEDGEMGFLAGREQTVVEITAGDFRFTDAAGETFIFETDGGVFRMTEKGAVMLVGVAYPKEEAAAKRQERADLLAEDKKKQEQSLADYKMTRAALMRAFEKLKSAKRKY